MDASKYQLKQVTPTIVLQNTSDEHAILNAMVAYCVYLPPEILNNFLSSMVEESTTASKSGAC